MIIPLFLRICACGTILFPHFLRIEVVPIDTVDFMKELCKEKKMNQQALAEAVGVKEDTVSNWFRRKAASYTKYLPQIAVALGTTTEYLLTGEGPRSRDQIVTGNGHNNLHPADGCLPPIPGTGTVQSGAMGTGKSTLIADTFQRLDMNTFHRIPILGRISAGLPLYAEQHIEGYTLTDLNGGAEYFALRVSGDSMNAARIQDGDILIVRRQDEVENGEVAVVMVGDDDATVKRFYATGSTVTLMPQSTNPDHQPQIYDTTKTSIRVIGKVVEVKITL